MLAGPGVRVVLSGGRVAASAGNGNARALELAPAQFEWHDASRTLALTNAGQTKVDLVEFELK